MCFARNSRNCLSSARAFVFQNGTPRKQRKRRQKRTKWVDQEDGGHLHEEQVYDPARNAYAEFDKSLKTLGRDDMPNNDICDSVSDDVEQAWQEYWAKNGEYLVWQRWVEKYPNNVDPNYIPVEFDLDVVSQDVEIGGSTVNEPSIDGLESQGSIDESVSAPDLDKDDEASKAPTVVKVAAADTTTALAADDPLQQMTELNTPEIRLCSPCKNKDARLSCNMRAICTQFEQQTLDTEKLEMTSDNVKLIDMIHDYGARQTTSPVDKLPPNSPELSTYDDQWKSLWDENYTEVYMYYYKLFLYWCNNEEASGTNMSELLGGGVEGQEVEYDGSDDDEPSDGSRSQRKRRAKAYTHQRDGVGSTSQHGTLKRTASTGSNKGGATGCGDAGDDDDDDESERKPRASQTTG